MALERGRPHGAPGITKREGARRTAREESCRAEFRSPSFLEVHARPDTDGCAGVALAQGGWPGPESPRCDCSSPRGVEQYRQPPETGAITIQRHSAYHA